MKAERRHFRKKTANFETFMPNCYICHDFLKKINIFFTLARKPGHKVQEIVLIQLLKMEEKTVMDLLRK